MNTLDSYMVYGIIALLLVVIISTICILRSPFHYPYFIHSFDVSGKRAPQIEDLVDEFLNAGNFYRVQEHGHYISQWKQECRKKIEKQTRYRQQNYVKTSYKVSQITDEYTCSYNYLRDRDRQLRNINHECTLRNYHSKNQRKLMTKELRKKIMVRDHHTCQSCGKYMPDEVGLHIDHIVPVSKGGKTVPSNLQVLCSKCNGNKSNKL